MQHRVIQGEETFIHGVPSRRWLTKRSSCVLIDRPRVGHSGPRSSRWGNRLRSIGRQWQRKRASFILWRWSSVDSDQSTTLTLINSFIGERLQETLLMHTWDCAFVCFLLVCSGSIFISCWWSLCSCQVVFCVCSAVAAFHVTFPLLSVCSQKQRTSISVLQSTAKQRPRHPILTTSGLLMNVVYGWKGQSWLKFKKKKKKEKVFYRLWPYFVFLYATTAKNIFIRKKKCIAASEMMKIHNNIKNKQKTEMYRKF